ncbi:MAG: hypothetical protein HY269_03625 [Deltaproteobacteria bacterium]|nr:hypothetical protein [Deltaproteobacteria bacterium]
MTFQWQHPYKLLSRREFATRYVRLGFIATPILLGSLALGVCGYHYTEGIPWLDSLLNASMILGGMGPVDPLHTKVGKLFASFYALYSGLLLISLAGLMLAPVVHRLLHKFHIEIEKPEDSKAEGAKSTTDKADED